MKFESYEGPVFEEYISGRRYICIRQDRNCTVCHLRAGLCGNPRGENVSKDAGPIDNYNKYVTTAAPVMYQSRYESDASLIKHDKPKPTSAAVTPEEANEMGMSKFNITSMSSEISPRKRKVKTEEEKLKEAEEKKIKQAEENKRREELVKRVRIVKAERCVTCKYNTKRSPIECKEYHDMPIRQIEYRGDCGYYKLSNLSVVLSKIKSGFKLAAKDYLLVRYKDYFKYCIDTIKIQLEPRHEENKIENDQ